MTVSLSSNPRTQQGLPIFWQLTGPLHPGEPSQNVSIDTARFKVGRRPGLNLTLPSMQVSMVHAELMQIGGRIFIRDLNSTNGTYVNGRRINSHDTPLRDGDRIRMGTVELRLKRRWVDESAAETGVLGDTAEPFQLGDAHAGPSTHDDDALVIEGGDTEQPRCQDDDDVLHDKGDTAPSFRLDDDDDAIESGDTAVPFRFASDDVLMD